MRLARGGHGALQGFALTLHRHQCAGPDVAEQLLHRAMGAGHGVGEREVGVAGVAVQPGLFVAQPQDLSRHVAVVVLAVVFAAADPGPPGLLAQVAALREGQERHDERARQRDHGGPGVTAVGRRLAGSVAHVVGQAGEVGFAVQPQLERGLVVQDVLRKTGRQPGQLFHHLGIALPGLCAEPGPRTHEVQVHALEQALLLGAQAQALTLPVQLVDAGEQHRVHVHRAVVCGQRAGHRALHRLQLRAGVRRRQVVEDRRHAVEPTPAAVEGGQRVVEARRRALRGNRAQLVQVLLHRHLEGRLEVFDADVAERRQAVRRVPVCEQRVGGVHVVVSCMSGAAGRRWFTGRA